MKKDNLIPIQDFCVHHHIEVNFIDSLAEIGVIQVVHLEQTQYFETDKLDRVEMLVRLHQELNIHTDDIDIIDSLVLKVATLQEELRAVKQRLSFYEQLG